jgi:hypothetical protein
LIIWVFILFWFVPILNLSLRLGIQVIMSHRWTIVKSLEDTRSLCIDIIMTATTLPHLGCCPPLTHILSRMFCQHTIVDVCVIIILSRLHGFECYCNKQSDVFNQKRNYLSINVILKAKLFKRVARSSIDAILMFFLRPSSKSTIIMMSSAEESSSYD